MHTGQGLQWRDHRSRQTQRQHQITELSTPGTQPCRHETEQKAGDGQHTEHDQRLLGTVMQDVFEPETATTDEALARFVEQTGQGEVHRAGIDYQQQRHQQQRNTQRQAKIEITRRIFTP